jgi:hypothetical protein
MRQLSTQEPCRELSEQALCVRSRRLQAPDHVDTVEAMGSSPFAPTTKAQVRGHCRLVDNTILIYQPWDDFVRAHVLSRLIVDMLAPVGVCRSN